MGLRVSHSSARNLILHHTKVSYIKLNFEEEEEQKNIYRITE
jgi:hypothetical protein